MSRRRLLFLTREREIALYDGSYLFNLYSVMDTCVYTCVITAQGVDSASRNVVASSLFLPFMLRGPFVYISIHVYICSGRLRETDSGFLYIIYTRV